MNKHLIIYTVMLMLSACGGGSSKTSEDEIPVADGPSQPVKSTDNLAIPDNRELDTYNILILGNSHVTNVESLLKKNILS
ncbi:hypothetical protein [Pseudoalteromonas sp. SaAl2]